MKYVFKRIDEIDLRSFEGQMQQQYAALDTLLEGRADNSEIFSYVEEMIEDGRPCKKMPEAIFWGDDEPEKMPGDARGDFFYMLTYLNTAFLIQAFCMIPELIRERVPDFEDKLARAMTACSGRGFAGHGCDKNDFVWVCRFLPLSGQKNSSEITEKQCRKFFETLTAQHSGL